MATEEEDPLMKMYEAQAIVIEKEAEMEELRRRIEEFERERLERNQGEPSSSSRELWAAILKLEESNALQKQRAEQSERTLEESMRNIQVRLEEETGRFDQMERRLEEIVARLERNEAENVQKGMEVRTTQKGFLEKITTLEDRINRGNETILIMGGRAAREILDEMVILDRKTSTWKVLELKLPCKNSGGGSALLNGEIYIFGGYGLKKKLYKLDSQQMRWIELAEMNEGRGSISNSSLVFQGCIWAFGGRNGNRALDTVEKYCPERNEWIKMPGMSQKRNDAAAAVCNEKIFVSGGYDGWTSISERTLTSMECFDPTSGVWTPMVDMPGDRCEHSMISDGSCLFVMGGWKGDNFKTVWRIRPSEENAAWEELQPMNESRSCFPANSLCCSTPGCKNEIYAIGGWNGKKNLDSVEIFDGERWREGPKLPNGCSSMSSVVIPSSLAETLLRY